MSGKKSRTKGHNLERSEAIDWREFYPDARRHLEYHGLDANGVDLINTGDWLIQCKAYKNYPPVNKIDEIKPKGKRLLILKADRKPIIYCTDKSNFLGLLRENKRLKEENEKLKHLLTVTISKSNTPQ